MTDHECMKEKELDELWKKVNKMHDRMHVDNGKPCFQTVRDRNARFIKVIMWVVTVICGSVIAMGIRIIMTAKLGA